MLLIKNGRVMDPKSGLDQVCDVICLLWGSSACFAETTKAKIVIVS